MEQVKTLADLSLHLQHSIGAPHCLPMLLESHFSSGQGCKPLSQKCCRTASVQPCLQKDLSPLLQVVMFSARPMCWQDVLSGPWTSLITSPSLLSPADDWQSLWLSPPQHCSGTGDLWWVSSLTDQLDSWLIYHQGTASSGSSTEFCLLESHAYSIFSF